MSQTDINFAEQSPRIARLVIHAGVRNAERLKANREWTILRWRLLATGPTAAAAVALLAFLS